MLTSALRGVDLLPAAVAALAAVVVLTPVLHRVTGRPHHQVAGLLSSAALFLALTLSPTDNLDVVRSCGLALPGDALSRLVAPRADALNLVVLAPLGLALGLLPRPSRRLLALAVSLPVLVEAVQYAVLPLGRACESWDVVTNLIGLVAGLAAGAVWRAGPGRRRPPAP